MNRKCECDSASVSSPQRPRLHRGLAGQQRGAGLALGPAGEFVCCSCAPAVLPPAERLCSRPPQVTPGLGLIAVLLLLLVVKEPKRGAIESRPENHLHHTSWVADLRALTRK